MFPLSGINFSIQEHFPKTPATTPEYKDLHHFQSATQESDVAVKNQDNSFKNNDVAPVAVSKGGVGEKEQSSVLEDEL